MDFEIDLVHDQPCQCGRVKETHESMEGSICDGKWRGEGYGCNG